VINDLEVDVWDEDDVILDEDDDETFGRVSFVFLAISLEWGSRGPLLEESGGRSNIPKWNLAGIIFKEQSTNVSHVV
jgi:hypothetical protein